MIINHKFIKDNPINGKEIIIIGTFNPNIEENKAEFFYSRNRNYFWELLNEVFEETNNFKDKNSIENKKSFINNKNIELTDLIISVDINESNLSKYSDELLINVVKWNTDEILYILKQNKTKKVFFTRKSFNKVNFIKIQIKRIEEFCLENEIIFQYLPTPSRFINDKKIKEWKNKFNGK